MKVLSEADSSGCARKWSRSYGGPFDAMPVGIVVRESPGVTRWAGWSRKAVAVLPGAGDAAWTELRREGDTVEYHAGTLVLELFGSDTEAYRLGLSAREPSLFVVMRESGGDLPELVLVTASPYEAQDYMDSGEEVVEPVEMPEGIVAWIRDFIDLHHEDEVFVKRRRDRVRTDIREDGRGDSRVQQTTDVYRAPRRPGERRAAVGLGGRTMH